MKSLTYLALLLLLILNLGSSKSSSSPSNPAHYIKLHQDENFSCTLLTSEPVRKFRGFKPSDDNNDNALHIRIKAAIESPPDSYLKVEDVSKIIEIYARRLEVAEAHLETLCKTSRTIPRMEIKPNDEIHAPEIIKIIDGGDQTNRIDVVFMGDGYQLEERQKFFDDIEKLTTEMFNGVTFRSYLPLFNIWAIYVESVESGIGYTGTKDTPFKLYREAGQLRGIYTANASYARQVCTLTGISGCDYPSIIGNDDFYGGLGGEFVISTKSNRTGTVVLRHEMGHNFVDVGEEYDNGQVYRGVNAASNLASLRWQSWLTDGPEPKEERAIYRILEYPWLDLTESESGWSFTFTSDGLYDRWYLAISVSAAGEKDSLEFTIDGQVLPWTSHGFDDREFYDWYGDEGFSQGTHNFSVRSKTPPTNKEIPRMICSVRLHEFGNETEFHQSNSYISAYPTWDVSRRKTLRPTNAGCLMRNMTHNEFCPICREGMWYQFLERISLIDSIDVAPTANPDDTRNVTLSTLKLGQLRAPGNEVEGEKLEVTWTRNGVEQIDFRDQFFAQASVGNWAVRVNLTTPEVRSDPTNLLIEIESFIIT